MKLRKHETQRCLKTSMNFTKCVEDHDSVFQVVFQRDWRQQLQEKQIMLWCVLYLKNNFDSRIVILVDGRCIENVDLHSYFQSHVQEFVPDFNWRLCWVSHPTVIPHPRCERLHELHTATCHAELLDAVHFAPWHQSKLELMGWYNWSCSMVWYVVCRRNGNLTSTKIVVK